MTDSGAFYGVFDENLHYLSLLHLDHPGASAAIAAVQSAAAQSPDIEKEIVGLLEDSDWRAHLPASVAMAFITPSEHLIGKAWDAFAKGSWVSPQIAAVLSLCDPAFLPHAEQRLSQLCPVVGPPSDASPLHKHVETGPADNYGRSSKAVSALVTLLRRHDAPHIRSLIEQKDVEKMVREDIDGGGRIAERWLTKLRQCVEKQSGKLQPPSSRSPRRKS